MEKICGIYRIVCTKNGRFYYGSSVNINKRWIKHRCDLKNNKHQNIILQRCFNKHGEKYFRIEIVELTSQEKLLEIENIYL